MAAAEFDILSTTNKLKGYSTGLWVFGNDMILLMKHMVDWELICQRNQTQINKYDIRKYTKRVNHDNKFGDKVVLNNYAA